MRYLLALFCCLSCCLLQAQDISGRWEGNFGPSLKMTHPQRLVVDIVVSRDSIIRGSSHLYYSNGDYEHYTLKGIYRRKTKTVYFHEDSTLSLKLSNGDNCLGRYSTRLKTGNGKMRLDGYWLDPSGVCGNVSVWLEKKIIARPPVKTPGPRTPVAAKPKDKNLERPIDPQSLIEVSYSERDSIKIEVLDNAYIDNDAVSIYVNGEKVVSKQVLSAKPIVFYVSVSKSIPLCRIVMAAESMGSNPPCTALMRVTINGKVHQTTLSSNMGNNGTLELFLKE
jgi:hypothetical protein